MKYVIQIIFASFFLLTLFISGCVTSEITQLQHESDISPSAKSYLQKAATSEGTTKQQYELRAANQLLIDNNIKDTQQFLTTIETKPLSPILSQEKALIEAQLALKKNQPHKAIQTLRQIRNIPALSNDEQIKYYQIASNAYLRSNNLPSSLIAQIYLNTLNNQPQSLDIWMNLQKLKIKTLQKMLFSNNDKLIQGWLQLAFIAKKNANEPKRLVTSIQGWKIAYPNHPVNQIIPDPQQLNNAQQTTNLTQIAFLLPLHGQFGKMGQAIRDGFMTAFYVNIQTWAQKPTIQIYDTSKHADISALYRKAIQEGAQFIIGPLQKNNVLTLAQENSITVPTLALNYLPKNQSAPKNFFQFGLSPEQSAKQSANQAWQHNVRNILIMAPQGDWGDNITTAFETQWKKLGGTIVDRISLTTYLHFSEEISNALHTDQSKARIVSLTNTLHTRIRAAIRRRQDIDGIFLVATPAQAREIQPLLKYYYAGNLPIFSISTIYTGHPNRIHDRDLNGIYFNDIPWLLERTVTTNQLKQQIQKLWPQNFKTHSRFYALGVDTVTLSLLLQRLQALPNFPVKGVTGNLFLTTNQQIYCQLLQDRFYRGAPRAYTQHT